MVKQFLTALGVFLVAVVVFLVMQIVTPREGKMPSTPSPVVTPQEMPLPNPPNEIPTLPILRIGATSFFVEVADEPQEQIQGLSGRASLSRDRGLLFLFPTEGRYDFWMKDMQFPIDIIWIREGRVVGISERAQPEGSRPTAIYSPPEPVDQVLEINAGMAAEKGIQIGDEVSLP